MLVAVYGSLKEGYKNNRRFLNGLHPLHALFVEIPFRMYEGDAYPMIVSSLSDHPIFVEVFEVDADTLEKLDGLEALYNYHCETILLTELERETELYVFSEPDPPPEFTTVESGKWSREID